MDRRITLGVIVALAGLLVGGGALLQARKQVKAKSADTASCGMPIGKKAATRLPKDTIALAPASSAEFKGFATCGSCTWGIGEDCNTMLWDKAGHHVVAVMPNDKLSELQKLTGT